MIRAYQRSDAIGRGLLSSTAVRRQCLVTTHLQPTLEKPQVAYGECIKHHLLMVAAQYDPLVTRARRAGHQAIQHLSRLRAPIDHITKEDNCCRQARRRGIGFDCVQQSGQEIVHTMHIAYAVNECAARHCGLFPRIVRRLLVNRDAFSAIGAIRVSDTGLNVHSQISAVHSMLSSAE